MKEDLIKIEGEATMKIDLPVEFVSKLKSGKMLFQSKGEYFLIQKINGKNLFKYFV
jgi:hypothetical protein